MPRTEDAEAWFDAVYDAVQQIPHGKVTSYGWIARLLGRPECPRQVGVCLKHLPSFSSTGEHRFHENNVPWQRVVNAKGGISPRGPGSTARQAAALRREGVTVTTGPLGDFTVNLTSFGWFPENLPSDEPQDDDSSDGEEEQGGNNTGRGS